MIREEKNSITEKELCAFVVNTSPTAAVIIRHSRA